MSSITIKTGTGIEYKSSGYIFSDEDMGNASISLDLSLDAQVDPAFSAEWTIDYNGETFRLTTLNPVGFKDTSSLRYRYSLVFSSERSDLSRYIMQDFASSGGENVVPQKQIFSFSATLSGFVDRFNANLGYWFRSGRWEMRVNPGFEENSSPVLISCSNITLWSLLQSLWDNYGVRWYIAQDSGGMVIFVAYDAVELEHIFEYGIADGGEKGLVKIERSPSNDNVITVLQGTGSSKNKPYNYFKSAGNSFTIPDPDANEALEFVNFLGIMPISYRQYMQGWNDAESGSYQPGQSEAYGKGYSDFNNGDPINPINYVKSDNISKYGEKWGGLEQSNEIFPTIIGSERAGIGRVDEIVAVESIVNDDYTSNDNTGRINAGQVDVDPMSGEFLSHTGRYNTRGASRDFVIEKNYNEVVVAINCISRIARYPESQPFVYGEPDGATLTVVAEIRDSNGDTLAVKEYENLSEKTLTFKDIPSGDVSIYINIKPINTTSPEEQICTIYSTPSIRVYNYDLPSESETFSQTFDVWMKNIWNTTQGAGESDADYTERVWGPLVSTEDMTVLFDSGLLAGEDYEFVIAVINGDIQAVPDRTKSINGVNSEWRVSLIKSDAELETINLYLPNKTQNAVAGDYMHFINIEMPYDPYVYAAEQKVEDWMNAELSKIDDEFASFSIQASRIFINNSFSEKEKLRSGSKIRLRDARLIGTSYVVLHVNSVVKTFTEDSINPEWEITVTDSVSINKDPVSLIQSEVESLGTSNLSSQQQIDEMVKAMSRIFLRKDGLSDTSYSETSFKEDLKIARSMLSDDFLKGDVGGNGFGMYRDSAGNSTVEVDKVVVRKEMVVNQLIVNQVTHYGGKRMYSAAGLKVSKVEEFSYRFFIPAIGEMVEILNALGDGEYFETNILYVSSTESDDVNAEAAYITSGGSVEVTYASKSSTIYHYRRCARAALNGSYYIGSTVNLWGASWIVWRIEGGLIHLCESVDALPGSEWSGSYANINEVGASSSSDGLANTELVYEYSNDGVIGHVVENTYDVYRCFFDTNNGSLLNLFAQDDLCYCQRYSPVDNAVIKYYWRKLENLGDDFIDLSKIDKDPAGSGVPSDGDNIAQVGNKTNASRQNVMIVDQIGDPSTTQYSGINNYSFGDKNYIGYGVDISSGEAFFYTYGESYVGDRDKTAEGSTYVAFEDRGDGKKLYVKGEVIIDGGLLGGTIAVVDPSTGQPVAGLSGDSDVMIWAGSASPNDGLFKVMPDGSVVAKKILIEGDSTFNGTLDGAGGTFDILTTKKGVGEEKASISFDDSNKRLWFQGDLQHQGYNPTLGRGYRFLTSNVWCRGGFGSLNSNTVVIDGSTATFHVNGLDSASGGSVSVQMNLLSGYTDVYIIPLYGSVGDANGFPVDLVVINSSGSTHLYVLQSVSGKKVTVVNSNDNSNHQHIYAMGEQKDINGGYVRDFVCVGSESSPSSSGPGDGWLAGPYYDNNW